MRTSFLPYHRPSIGRHEIDAVVETLESGWLTTGPRTKQFEVDFAQAVGARHAIAVNSCTAALHLALDAVGVSSGDEVIVPTMTFAATAEVVTYFGATPVLVDCQRDTWNIDPAGIERAMTPRTKAIIPVHYAGQPCDMAEIMAIGRRAGVTVIEDAAHALPASYRGEPVGRIGDITCFSFYATKTLSTGEGGMITTEDDRATERMRMMALHGISKDAWKRYTAEGSWYYEILHPGFKYNLTDVAAALGVEQLKRQDEFLAARTAIARLYSEGLAGVPGLRCPVARTDRGHAWHLYVVEVDEAEFGLGRNDFIETLRAANIGTSVHFIPLHLHPYYRNRFGYAGSDFPGAFDAYQRIVSLPIYPAMSDEDVDDVIDAVQAVSASARARSTVAVPATSIVAAS